MSAQLSYVISDMPLPATNVQHMRVSLPHYKSSCARYVINFRRRSLGVDAVESRTTRSRFEMRVWLRQPPLCVKPPNNLNCRYFRNARSVVKLMQQTQQLTHEDIWSRHVDDKSFLTGKTRDLWLADQLQSFSLSIHALSTIARLSVNIRNLVLAIIVAFFATVIALITSSYPASTDEEHAKLFPIVDADRYMQRYELGQGGCGRVIEAQDTYVMNPANLIAIKISTRDSSTVIVNEARILRRLLEKDPGRQKQVVHLIESFSWPKDSVIKACISFALMQSSVYDMLIGLEPGVTLHPRSVRSIFLQVVEALEFLEEVSIVHGDLKSENILMKGGSLNVDGQWAYLSHANAKLADFGCSFSTAPEPGREPTPFNCGTSMLLAPERVLGMSSGHPGDVWSLGLSVLEWAAGLDVLEPLNCDTKGEMLTVMEKMVGKRLPEAMRDKATTCAGFVIKPNNRRQKSSMPMQEQHGLLHGLDNVLSYENVDHRHVISLCKQMLRLEPQKRITIPTTLAIEFTEKYACVVIVVVVQQEEDDVIVLRGSAAACSRIWPSLSWKTRTAPTSHPHATTDVSSVELRHFRHAVAGHERAAHACRPESPLTAGLCRTTNRLASALLQSKDVTFPTAPKTEVTARGNIVYSEVNREGVRKLEAYVGEMASGDTSLNSQPEISQEQKDHIKGLYEGVVRSLRKTPDQQRPLPSPQLQGLAALSADIIPLLHLKRRAGTTWEYISNITSVYLDILTEIATSGTMFEGKNALLTGVGKGSIGSKSSRACYPASKQDVEAVVDDIYETLGLDLDYILPFAAIPENGRQIELAHRMMLTNVLRLLGAVKTKKASRHIVTHPTQVILPFSPNHGLFGNDGLHSESKISLETLFNRWASESWGEYLCLAGAVIGWCRGTGLMGATNMVAEQVEAHGVLTFSSKEMAFNLLALMHPLFSASRNGGMDRVPDLAEMTTRIRKTIMQQSDLRRAIAKDNAADFKIENGSEVERIMQIVTVTPRANLKFDFPAIENAESLQDLSNLQGLLDLDRVIVITSFAEVGRWVARARDGRWRLAASSPLRAASRSPGSWATSIHGVARHWCPRRHERCYRSEARCRGVVAYTATEMYVFHLSYLWPPSPESHPSPILNLGYRARQMAFRRKLIAQWMFNERELLQEEVQLRLQNGAAVADNCVAARTVAIEQEAVRQEKDALSTYGMLEGSDPTIAPLRRPLAVWGLTSDDVDVHSRYQREGKRGQRDAHYNDIFKHLDRTPGNAVPVIVQKSLQASEF
ncbi:hypothetical protein BKA62DRAFT_667324 [Auriculariales sp. MPI-PUGE-AT-0066]|nr:hypothetical protein BKA62DRAFT_667324 [Auriculariales sp. MPI-PUGE-AT-0066]